MLLGPAVELDGSVAGTTLAGALRPPSSRAAMTPAMESEASVGHVKSRAWLFPLLCPLPTAHCYSHCYAPNRQPRSWREDILRLSKFLQVDLDAAGSVHQDRMMLGDIPEWRISDQQLHSRVVQLKELLEGSPWWADDIIAEQPKLLCEYP